MTDSIQADWDRRHLPFNLVTNIDAASKNAHGWTYILLSGDKKKMKIGHTIRSVYDRVFCLRSDHTYRSLDLHFLLAIKGKSYEPILHHCFENFRARYRWKNQHGQIIECNWQEHNKLIRSDTNTFQRVTTVELFHIPPIKIGKRLIEIVTTLLSGQSSPQPANRETSQ